MGTDTHLRDQQDLAHWIENKLGSNELWGGRQASSMLSSEILVELETCLQELEPHIKLSIIQSMVHLSPKTLQTWREPLFNLIEVARKDPDDWVETVSDIYRQFPDLGLIQCPSKPDSYFHRTQEELEKTITDRIGKFQKDIYLQVPPDSEYMPEYILKTSIHGDSSADDKMSQFTNRGKMSKSAKLLEDVKRAYEQQKNPSNKKNHALISTFPIKIRSTAKNLNNDLPMKGISSANALKMSSGFTNESKKYQQRKLMNRNGGAMLIDIEELPKPNRRRKNVETILLPTEKKTMNNTKACTNINSSPRKETLVSEDCTNATELKEENNGSGGFTIETTNVPEAPSQTTNHVNGIQSENSQLYSQNSFEIGTNSTSATFSSESSFPESQQQTQMHFDQLFPSTSNTESFMMNAPNTSTFQHQFADFSSIANYNANQTLQPFEGILKDGNKLTPVSYNLILSFLRGCKDNPLQEKLGQVVTLPFSESIDFEQTPNGINAVHVEIFFQMDYRTGEWKRLRKSKPLSSEELGQYGHLFTTNLCGHSNAGAMFQSNQAGHSQF